MSSTSNCDRAAHVYVDPPPPARSDSCPPRHADDPPPAIDECELYQPDCNVPVHICRNGLSVCANDYWHELNDRLACDENIFSRWRSLYEITTGDTGRWLLQQRADCRRKPFLPRRCELCTITDDVYLTEQLCKEYLRPKCEPVICHGDYQEDPSPRQHPPAMIMTNPRHCFKHKSVGCFDKKMTPPPQRACDIGRADDHGGRSRVRDISQYPGDRCGRRGPCHSVGDVAQQHGDGCGPKKCCVSFR